MRSFEGSNYSKYSRIHFDLVNQHWYNQEIIGSK